MRFLNMLQIKWVPCCSMRGVMESLGIKKPHFYYFSCKKGCTFAGGNQVNDVSEVF